MLKKVEISSFKCIEKATLDLAPINVLVGGNNSGKSCILQGIHFGIALSQSRKISGAEQFPPEKLRYCPTDDFLDLRYGRRLTEGPSIEFKYYGLTEEAPPAIVTLQRGRNGVVKAQTTGGELLDQISNPRGFFSIYVPGLAGISIREEYRSELVVSNGIARGDANLYLRNVLLRINRNLTKRDIFTEYLDSVFPGITINTDFVESNDLWIKSTAKREGMDAQSIDMVGTGLLQAIQLLAYVSNYTPKLLLLDEPDAHLHPSNQRLLAQTLGIISEKTDTKIILATHSRHLLDTLAEDQNSRLFWVKNGKIKEQTDWADIAILMDLGALDKGDMFLAGNYKYLVWTEDSDISYLTTLLKANGANIAEIFIFSYKSSSKFESAVLMANFMDRIRPGVKLIIHRDRDFMTDSEVERLKNKYGYRDRNNIHIFITKGSDIESYFASPSHIACITGKSIDDETINIESIIQNNITEFTIAFREKREDIKRDLYRTDPNECPSTTSLLPSAQVPIENAVGKLLLRKIKAELQSRGINGGLIGQATSALSDENLASFFSDADRAL